MESGLGRLPVFIRLKSHCLLSELFTVRDTEKWSLPLTAVTIISSSVLVREKILKKRKK